MTGEYRRYKPIYRSPPGRSEEQDDQDGSLHGDGNLMPGVRGPGGRDIWYESDPWVGIPPLRLLRHVYRGIHYYALNLYQV